MLCALLLLLQVSYHNQIRPILTAKCAACHTAAFASGGLDSTSVEALKRGGTKAGPALLPGKPDQSPLIQYIRGVRQPRMPNGLPPLAPDQIELIRKWIEAGAKDDSPAFQAEAKPAAVDIVTALAFSEDAEQLMALRRKLRTALLPPAPAAPKVQRGVFNDVDRFIVAKWKGQPPRVATDLEFLRRVYLDLAGAIPTIEEAERFLADPAPDKRARLVDELLARADDYAAHWTPFWEDAIGSTTTDQQGGIPGRGNYREWIYEAFRENVPYDVFVASLIDPTMPRHKPAKISVANDTKLKIHYIRNQTHTDTLQSSANVAQVFLGTSIKCASCHSHFLNPEWPQERALAFSSMFSAEDLELIRCEKPSGKRVAARFPFELPGVPADAPKGETARLRRAAQLITDPTNPRFAKVIVNRLWKRYLGAGLFEPADDFRDDVPASHPELLAWLADDLIRHEFDLKRTIRLILTSRTYQLRYNPALEDKPGGPRLFRSPQARRPTAEQLLDSVQVAVRQKLDGQARTYLDRSSTALTRALGRPASRNEISTARSSEIAVVQVLELLNGEEFNRAVYHNPLVDELASMPPAKAVDRAYRAVLSRPPSAKELELGVALLGPPQPVNRHEEDEVWMDDELPEGAKAGGSDAEESWSWVEAPVFSGKRAHTQGGTLYEVQRHLALGSAKAFRLGPDDRLFTHVYLDPQNPPKQVLMQWNDGTWGNRAVYWGEEALPPQGSFTRYRMGPLPKAGEWVRLEVPVREVGIRTDSGAINGWSFENAGGKVFWDKCGVVRVPPNPAAGPAGDLLWALFTSPEFQFVR